MSKREEGIRQVRGQEQARREEAKKGRGDVLQRLEGGRIIEYRDGHQRGQRGGLTEIRRRQKQ